MARDKALPPKVGSSELSKIREKPGMSGAFKHKSSAYAGPEHTFPIGDIKHARNALARAHFSPHPEAIREKVYKKYPELKKRHEEREGKKNG